MKSEDLLPSQTNDDRTRHIGRRRALALFTAGAGALFVLDGCKDSTPSPTGGGCGAPIDETSRNLRTALKYVEATDNPSKLCKACMHYEAQKFGDCGGCKLFSGPVKPMGSCVSYAPSPATAAPARSG